MYKRRKANREGVRVETGDWSTYTFCENGDIAKTSQTDSTSMVGNDSDGTGFSVCCVDNGSIDEYLERLSLIKQIIILWRDD